MDMDSRSRLVEAMRDLLWERGYADTSPRDVRERSGVGHGSMYHHFPTKKDLALAALERNVSELLLGDCGLEGPGTPLSRIQAQLSQPRDVLSGCKVGRMTQDAQVRGDQTLLEPVTRAFAHAKVCWGRVLSEAVEAGELRSDLNPERLAQTMMAVTQGGYVLAMASRNSRPFEEACAGVLDLLRAATP